MALIHKIEGIPEFNKTVMGHLDNVFGFYVEGDKIKITTPNSGVKELEYKLKKLVKVKFIGNGMFERTKILPSTGTKGVVSESTPEIVVYMSGVLNEMIVDSGKVLSVGIEGIDFGCKSEAPIGSIFG